VAGKLRRASANKYAVVLRLRAISRSLSTKLRGASLRMTVLLGI
jgi:hypothetical protein